VNYLAIETVLGEYRALNGALPPAGSAWATSPTHGGPYLQQWPESVRYYTITWNGDELSVSPARGVASHGSYGTHTPVTGCFAAQQRWAAP
jgi:hypothetical protein